MKILKQLDKAIKELKAIEDEYKANPDYIFGVRVDLNTGEIVDKLGWLKKNPDETILPIDVLIK